MAPKVTENRKAKFIEALEDAGGTSGNSSLRKALGWDEELYWVVQGRLIEEGNIVAGRGKGGSVRFTESQAATSEISSEEIQKQNQGPTIRERDLYPALKKSIETKWINRFALDDVIVDETHSRGSKDTGGTFTRPDITAAGIRRYVYLPKRLEIVTFEIKTSESVTVMGVLEAIAHREAAHRAFVIYAIARPDFEGAIEAERITELAQKYGVGVVLAEQSDSVESWEILIDAIRHEPDPARLDRFLHDLPNAEMKKQLSKWKE